MKVDRYQCDQCGKVGQWGPEWASMTLCLGKGYRGYEVDVHVCSDACAAAWDAENGELSNRQLEAKVIGQKKRQRGDGRGAESERGEP